MRQDERSEEEPESQDESGSPEVAQEATLKEELGEALREKAQFRTMAQRAQADLVNYKRRAAAEQGEAVRSAESELLLRFLSVVDDLDRALEMVPEDAVAPGWLDGLRLVQRNIAQVLDSEGVSKMEPLGQRFEPFECEAVLYQETSEEDEGKVISVVRDGYRRRDRVLRAAQVVVSKKPEATTEEEAEEDPIG